MTTTGGVSVVHCKMSTCPQWALTSQGHLRTTGARGGTGDMSRCSSTWLLACRMLSARDGARALDSKFSY